MSIYSEARGSIVLKVIIVALLGLLLYILYRPYVIREEEEQYRRESRARMINLRSAQLQYIADYGIYAPSAESLVTYIKRKFEVGSLSATNFTPLSGGTFVPESLTHSPRSLRPYVIVAVDTTTIKKYVLEDPDGFGSIGSLTDDNRINKASWED